MDKKKEILIIECISSGRMYVEEAIDRGYKALVVNPECSDAHMMALKHKVDEEFSNKYNSDEYECIYESNDCDAIVKAVAGHDIVACVAASEFGVRVTDQVCKALNLHGNDPETTWRRCTKAGMIQSLEEAGIRAIKTCVVNSVDDIVNFWNNNNITKAFMKFSESAAGYANKSCNSLRDAVAYYKYVKTIPNYFGNDDDQILLQEFVDGDEYVVNTVSCKGKHMLTDIWKYTKVMNDSGQVIYQSSQLITELDDKLEQLVDYTFKVLTAEGFEYGPSHNELKIDSKGPILIETNPRPMGDSMTRDYMRDIVGHCIVDLSLDSVLDSDNFVNKIPSIKDYKTNKCSYKKYIILKKSLEADMSSAFTIAENLQTFHNHFDYEPAGVTSYKKTKDLGDTPMILKLASDDPDAVKRDVELMNEIEQDFSVLIACHDPNLAAGHQETIEDILQILDNPDEVTPRPDKATRYLVITDKDAYEVTNGVATPVSDSTPRIFDRLYYADASATTLSRKIEDILSAMRYLVNGGKVAYSFAVSDMMPYGERTIPIFKRVIGLD